MESKKKIILVAIVAFTIMFSYFAVAYFQDVTTRWVVQGENALPSIVLNFPDDENETENLNIEFNWTTNDADADVLDHMWFLDLIPTMNSPLKEIEDTDEVTNYSHLFTYDGLYYWKVEVTDGRDVVSSETRSISINNNTENAFPSISSYSISNDIGDIDTVFYYQLTYLDSDNNSPSFVKVIIDGTEFNMHQQEVNDTNCSDGKDYYYATNLGLGLHNYSFYISDGYAVNMTTVIEEPFVVEEYYQTPEIALTSPISGSILSNNTVTFEWNVTDGDDDILYTELWLWKGLDGIKQIYNVNSGFSIELELATYYWQVHVVDDHTENLSSKWTFGVISTGKQCSITIQPDETTEETGSSFTGDLVITNEGPIESYEVYWYVELWNLERTTRLATDSGSLAVTTTATVSYNVPVDESIEGGNYLLRAFAYDNIRDTGNLVGQDEINVVIDALTILPTDTEIKWFSLIYDSPRYVLSVEDYLQAEQIRLPLTYDYNFLFFTGSRPLNDVEVYLFSNNTFVQLSVTKVSTDIYKFGELNVDEGFLVVVINPSITDCTTVYNWLHKGDIN